jgi:MFS family permease
MSHLALALYPLAFRRRYGEEIRSLIDESPPRAMAAFDLLRGALAAHVRHSPGLAGAVDATDVIRSSASGTLACWVLFAVAGFGFYKTTEDHAFSAAQHSHLLLGGAHLTVQVVAVIASIAVVGGALPLVLAALWAAWGDRRLRRIVAAPFVAVGIFALLTAVLVGIAHRTHHVPGALGPGAFIGWELAAGACAVVCVAVSRRVLFEIAAQRGRLLAALALGTLATAAMVLMTAAAGAYALTLPHDDMGLASQPNGPLGILDVHESLLLQALVMCAAAAHAVVTTRRGWHAARS